MSRRNRWANLCWPFLLFLSLISAQQIDHKNPAEQPVNGAYVLGPDDQIRIWVLGLEDLFDKPVRIDSGGRVDLPLIGSTVASGITVEELRTRIAQRLEGELKNPRVAITIVEFGSQPVSVLGSVNTPGVHQLHGRKTLAEVLSLAGGLRPDAGSSIRISREIGQPIALPSARRDSSGQFSVAEVKVQDIMEARNPESNIVIQPHDVITVPLGEMVYVIGAVRKPGGFILHERERISVLHALSLAEGLGPTPAPQNSRILRTLPGGTERREIAVDLKKVLAGKGENIDLQPNDILLIPTSTGKQVGIRAIDTLLNVGTGLAVWGH